MAEPERVEILVRGLRKWFDVDHPRQQYRNVLDPQEVYDFDDVKMTREGWTLQPGVAHIPEGPERGRTVVLVRDKKAPRDWPEVHGPFFKEADALKFIEEAKVIWREKGDRREFEFHVTGVTPWHEAF